MIVLEELLEGGIAMCNYFYSLSKILKVAAIVKQKESLAGIAMPILSFVEQENSNLFVI